MQVQVKLFARARDLVGEDVVELLLPSHSTVKHLRTALAGQYPDLQPISDQLFIAINEDYADDNVLIPEHATVACFPPVSGG